MSFSRYPKYKNSGVEWLGEVPVHWDVAKFRHHFTESDEKIEDTVVGPMLSVSGYRGIELKEYDDENRRRLDEELVGYRIVRPGQLVVNSMWLNAAGLGVSELLGHVSPAYRSYCFTSGLHRRFIHHLMRSAAYIQGYTSMVQGIRPNSLQLSRDDLMALPILIPSHSEQAKITSFLDQETSTFDGLVREQRRLIELLKEKRQAVISHAVTKGLNPHAPMKPSGIEWLGDVPEHWETRTIAKASTKITNGFVGPTRDILVESGTPYIQATHIKQGRINFDGGYFVTPKWSSAHAKSILAEGDVLIVQTGAGTGDIGLVTKDDVGFNCHALIIVTCQKNVLSGPFLASVLQSNYGRQKLESIQTGGMHPHLNCGNVKYVEIPIPPECEQGGIVEHIQDTLATCDSLVAEAQRAIDLLHERRTALISAAVTGKIDVRGLVETEAA